MNATTDMFQDTLKVAKEMVASQAAGGVECPCCGQYVQLYKRKLNSGQAYALIGLVRLHRKALQTGEDEWIHFTSKHKFRDGGGDFAKLRWWGLVEDKPNDDDKKRTSGFWKPTPKGIDFVNKKLKVASHVLVLLNAVQGFTEETIDIEDALNEKFDYRELMDAK